MFPTCTEPPSRQGAAREFPLTLAVATAASGGSSSQAGKKSEIDLEEMLKNMELMEDELDEVVIRKADAQRFATEAKWMAIARVNTDRPFSATAFFDNMKFV